MTILGLIGLWLLAVALVLVLFAGASRGRVDSEPSITESPNTMEKHGFRRPLSEPRRSDIVPRSWAPTFGPELRPVTQTAYSKYRDSRVGPTYISGALLP